jgi:hypothetical protein
MDEDTVQARGRSMEEAFFGKAGGRLPAGRPASIAAFDLESEIGNDHLRDDLRAHHVEGGTRAAMTLVPLIAVAWADRDLHERERQAVLQAAEAAGIRPDSASHVLLESWLSERPDPELFERWKSFIVALCADMDAADVAPLRADLVGRAEAVARSVGGLLGFGRISRREQEVLDELREAFPG